MTDSFLKMENIRADYEVIRIDLLVCNLDRIESILQEEMDRLKVIGQQDEERYQKELEKSYHQGKLVPVEVAALRKMPEEKKE